MTKLPKIEKSLPEDSSSQADLANQTRPQIGGALSGKNPEKLTGILAVLQRRLGQRPDHYKRPEGIDFAEVRSALEANSYLMDRLTYMEETGGEPDIIAVEKEAFVFADCSKESPSERRCQNYYQAEARALGYGLELLSEEAYRAMQKNGKFDMNSFSYLESKDVIYTQFNQGRARSGRLEKNGVVVVALGFADFYDPDGGWRGMLRVPRVKNQK